jgi:chromate transporter
METTSSPSLSTLFFSFLRIGLTAFGGPAMIGYIRKLSVEKHAWLNPQAFRDGIALCQAIPGATLMQMTAYIGLRARGVAGAAVSFIGFGLPAFLLMVILSAAYQQTRDLPAILSAFQGLRVIIIALIANGALSFARTNLKNWKGVVIAAASGLIFALGVHPMWVIVLAAVLGILLYSRQTFPAQGNQPAGDVRMDWAPVAILGAFLVGVGALWLVDRKLFDLVTMMAKIDLMAFGAGLSSLPLMHREVVDVRAWLANPVFMDGIALGQITPGPIVITATFVGYLVRGFFGSLLATIGIFLPSFLMVVSITPYFDRLRSYPNFNRATEAVSNSFVGLLAFFTYQFATAIPWDVPRLLIMGGAFAALLLKRDILWVVLAGAGISVIVL